jgi:hypothetical protein
MKRFLLLGNVVWILTAILFLSPSVSHAQSNLKVTIDLPSLDYDVIYLGDFIDISSNKLSKNIPNFSGTITVVDPPGTLAWFILTVKADIWFKGDPGPVTLASAETDPFKVPGTRSLTANDLAGGVSDIEVKSGYYENKDARKRIEDYAAKFPTAPVGQYFIEIVAYASTSPGPSGTKGNIVGKTQKVITVRNASPEEVQVNLIDPQPGATIASTLPTFSWNSPNPKVTLYVYEKLPVHQSPQEAITGIPYLKQDVEGRQTLTYPTDAQRRLEQNKTYVWYVETAVTTNRQTIQKRSEVRLFRIQTENQQSQVIQELMNNLGGAVSGTFSTLQSIGWQPTGRMTLDGKPLTLDDLKALITKLAAQNTQVTVRIE